MAVLCLSRNFVMAGLFSLYLFAAVNGAATNSSFVFEAKRGNLAEGLQYRSDVIGAIIGPIAAATLIVAVGLYMTRDIGPNVPGIATAREHALRMSISGTEQPSLTSSRDGETTGDSVVFVDTPANVVTVEALDDDELDRTTRTEVQGFEASPPPPRLVDIDAVEAARAVPLSPTIVSESPEHKGSRTLLSL